MDLSHLTSLGKSTAYPETYDPKLLVPIPRQPLRELLGVTDIPPFFGVDIWNAYEVSWLALNGVPQVAIATIEIPADSQCLIESKSLKLYLNSLNRKAFPSYQAVQATIQQDISVQLGRDVTVLLHKLSSGWGQIESLSGLLLDDLPIDQIEPGIEALPRCLSGSSSNVPQSFVSHLLRSRCPVTGQPDWASLQIQLVGSPIDPESLLRYIISLCDEQSFHEHCIEKIFLTIWQHCQPAELTVYGRYTRRGGIDINPWRSSSAVPRVVPNSRLIRQ